MNKLCIIIIGLHARSHRTCALSTESSVTNSAQIESDRTYGSSGGSATSVPVTADPVRAAAAACGCAAGLKLTCCGGEAARMVNTPNTRCQNRNWLPVPMNSPPVKC